jgi:hypothetical protein
MNGGHGGFIIPDRLLLTCCFRGTGLHIARKNRKPANSFVFGVKDFPDMLGIRRHCFLFDVGQFRHVVAGKTPSLRVLHAFFLNVLCPGNQFALFYGLIRFLMHKCLFL